MQYWLGLLFPCLALAQTATYQSSTVDLNGARVSGPVTTETKSGKTVEHTERMQSINGHLVPLERIEERVLRDDASGRLVERTIQRFDPNGNPTPPERVTIEQRGSATTTATYRGDINGAYRMVERSLTERHKSGATETSDTTVERPTINDSLEPVEKRSVVKTETSAGFEQSATTYRQGANGFYEALRVVTNHRQQPAGTSDEAAEYEIGSDGRLELHSQTVTKSTRLADGSETEVIDHFGQFVAGNTSTEGSALKLQERDTIQRRSAADGSIHETLFAQRPSLADPSVLSPGSPVSETVCRGACRP